MSDETDRIRSAAEEALAIAERVDLQHALLVGMGAVAWAVRALGAREDVDGDARLAHDAMRGILRRLAERAHAVGPTRVQMAVPAGFARMERVLGQVRAERGRQDAKWGVQDHPSVDPVLMQRDGGCEPERMASEYEIPTEPRAKALCEMAARAGRCTFAHIAVEELAEAVAAATAAGEASCRAELVQLAAVVVAWIEAIDRRGPGGAL